MSNAKFVKIDRFTVGCDPEGFFQKEETGAFVPSFTLMGGDKANPMPISEEGHSIQCDNVMFEYNIPPCGNKEEFISHNLFVQNYLQNTIATPNGLVIKMIASARFDKENLEDPKALEMGCSPDYNAYTGFENRIDGSLIKDTLRTGGGHIHIGYDNWNYISNMNLVKFLDLFISVPLILTEPDSERKKLYGKAGAFRHTKFGLEYRVTSNYVYSSPEVMGWLYDSIAAAIEAFNNELDITEDLDTIQDAINSKNGDLAFDLMKKYGILVYA